MSPSHLGTIALKISNISHLKQFHAQIILRAFSNDNYWVAQLISQCTRLHAPLPYTRLIFDLAHSKNVYVFTNMLKFYSLLDAHSDVLKLFDEMSHCAVRPDGFVYPILLKSAGKDGRLLHAQLVKLGHYCDEYVRNAIMDVYAKHGPIEVARQVFDEMSERTIADWNLMISGYWSWENRVEACGLFELIQEKNVVTWTAMVTGFSRVKDPVRARWYFDHMPERNLVSWNAMLSGYSRNGFAEETVNLFYEMMTAGVQPNETTCVAVILGCSSLRDPCLAESLVKRLNEKGVKLNCFIKTALLDMYAKCGSLEKARKVFNELGLYRNSFTWNAMVSAYARTGDLESAKELFDRMPEKNVVSWNSMISGYAQNGRSICAINLFKEMIRNKDVKPDEVTVASVISACGHLGALEVGIRIVNTLMQEGIRLSISGYNSLIFMYSKCGSIKDAKKVFEEMKTRDLVSYNTLITGYAAYGHGDNAVNLIYMMKAEGIKPDRISYIGALTACSHAGLLEDGRKVFESIKAPDVDHFACMIDLLGRVGKLDEAKELLDKMPMEPHAGVYGSLLSASRVHKRLDLGEFAANRLFELEPENSGNYVLLSNIYASAGKWDDVERVRGAMKKLGLTKTTGWSWVEYRGKMHKFIVGDRSHEQSESIYRKLAELQKKMRDAGYVADDNCVLRDLELEEKEEIVGSHSEKLAIAFALLVSEAGSVIRVVKNLRVCQDCHTAIKVISKMEGREIIVRDNNRFHSFSKGLCSCKDYW
ncbi:pentatricopeptide repeat-containing protein At1g14470 [Apium graveolens]|uniref:pentatricopeptide repeat-containing protein At1g14470 n=1 Tax=Apium graveolens TaxID=4045 RepID=UPI003D7900D1